ncbi:MAG: serine/threonine protein kinase, partial [Okeania sp. SIO2D1]|nr:serine/threonine protein kinase [Okeania sp. SIO2D1]
QLTLNIYTEVAEVEYLNGNFSEAQKLAELTLSQAKDVLEKVKLYEIKIQIYVAKNLMSEAFATGVQALSSLQVNFTNTPNNLQIIASFLQVKLLLLNKRVDRLIDLPVMTDSNKLAAMRILNTMAPAAAQANSLCFPLIVATMTKLSLKYGNATVSTFGGYVLYGAMLCAKLGDIEGGYRFGKLAIQLLNKLQANLLRCKVYYAFNSMIRHWKEHLRETIVPLSETIQIGLETGNLEFVGYAALNYNNNLFLLGEKLLVVQEKTSEYIELVKKLKIESMVACLDSIQQNVTLLLNYDFEQESLVQNTVDEVELPQF